MSSGFSMRLAGYRLISQIGETHNSIVYRAVKDGNAQTVVIKMSRMASPQPGQVARIKHEYDLMSGIDIDGIIKTLDFIDHEGVLALVLEDFGGAPLKEMIPGGFTMDHFLHLAIRLAEILGRLHQANICHHDIKPHNILVNPETGVVKIADFGIAVDVQNIDSDIANPMVMEGTLPYIAPEQTGRMNCAVDYRADLYSLGVTFYEMLTGQIPFRSKDAVDIIHAHIAKMPPSPRQLNLDIPLVVSNIVMKLLSKSVEERYQSGFGLAEDLRECLRQFQKTGQIVPFQLGLHDISPRFIIPQTLVGRDAEIYALRAAFERIGRGQVEIIFITGEAGIGKSSLAHDMARSIVGKRGYFIAGKYDQFRGTIPYSGVKQAFQGFVPQLLTQSDEQLGHLKERLLAALSPNGKIITDAIPEIELIIGKQPDVPELDPKETQNRFTLCFKNLIHVFADNNTPFVFFMDNMQWADPASFRLFQAVCSDRELQNTLFIGAYRDMEMPAGHPLLQVRETFGAAGIAVNILRLTALTPATIQKLIDALLHGAPDASLSLAQVVYDKTKGNPFFVHQFLKMLHDQHHLTFDHAAGWVWDLKQIRKLQVTENVVRFMSDQFHQLPSTHQQILKYGACIGNRFDLETLSFVSKRSLTEILSILDGLTNENLIYRAGNVYGFQHNRIQETAYLLLTPEERERIHYEIGQRELVSTPPEQMPQRAFYICDQLNLAHRLLSSQAERTRLAELNLKAGISAKEAAAYDAAAAYFTAGIELLPQDAWQTGYALTYALHIEQMECLYLNRNFEQAEKLFEIVGAQATTKIDKARAYNVMIILYTIKRAPRDAMELGIEALKIFNIHIPIDIGKAQVALELTKALFNLKKVGLEKIPDLPLMKDAELLAVNELMLNIGHPAFYASRNHFAFFALRSFNYCLTRGLVPHASIAFIIMATIVQNNLGNYELAGKLGEMALKLNQKMDNRQFDATVLHTFAFFIQHWKKHLRHDLDIYARVHELAVNTGNYIYVGHSINALAEARLSLDYRLDDILSDLKKHEDFIAHSKNTLISREYYQIIQWISALKGLTPVRHDLSGNGLDLEEHIAQFRREENIFGLCLSLLHKMTLLVSYRKYEEALPVAVELDRHIPSIMGPAMIAGYYYHYSFILIALLREASPYRQRRYTLTLQRNLKMLRKWASLCPENFSHMHDLICAEYAGYEGQFQEAVKRYHSAITSAHDNGFLHLEAIACERLAVLYLVWNYQEEAGIFIRRAYNCYAYWGASAKEQDLQERYPHYLRHEAIPQPAATDTEPSASESSAPSLDMATVIEVAQVIAGEIKLDGLLRQTMHLSIANAGAQRGYLLLESDGRLLVQASEDVATGEQRVLQAVLLDECDGVAASVVHYVYRRATPLILGNAGREENFRNDPHIVEAQCKSILCLPILNKGAVMAILYMENNLTADAFTLEHLKILQIISSQAAISLQNAKLYENITEEIDVRKKIQEALRVSEEKYRTILEEMPDIYSETDVEGVITFVNPAVCTTTGYNKQELIGANIRMLASEGDYERLEQFYENMIRMGLSATLLIATVKGKQGRITPMEIVVSPIRDKFGNLTGFRNLGRDITERKRLERDLLASHQKMQNVRVATILGLAKLAEYRDEATGTHLERIREYARILARELATKPEYLGYITDEYIEDIYHSSILHDIGKVGVPDAILLKPGKLTREEFEVIKIHTTLGGDVLRAVEGKIEGQSFLTLGKEIAYYHHEKWDGTGYPHGLKGQLIPLSARIVALADVYDALTSKRVYKEAFSHWQAVDIIVKDRGTHFAPDVVDAFLAHAEDFRKIREELNAG